MHKCLPRDATHHHHHHHHHVRLFKTMTKRIVTLDKKVNESIGPFKSIRVIKLQLS